MNGVNFLFDRCNTNNPCMGCKNRQVGCHGRCIDYAKFNKENRERCNNKKRKKETESDYRDFIITSYEKYGK